MRIALAVAVLAFAATQTAAQNNNPHAPPLAVYPMPPPPAVTTDGHDVPPRTDPVDSATRCLQYGKSIGVPADQMAEYTRRCALQ